MLKTVMLNVMVDVVTIGKVCDKLVLVLIILSQSNLPVMHKFSIGDQSEEGIINFVEMSVGSLRQVSFHNKCK